jgi:hypothetical protein
VVTPPLGAIRATGPAEMTMPELCGCPLAAQVLCVVQASIVCSGMFCTDMNMQLGSVLWLKNLPQAQPSHDHSPDQHLHCPCDQAACLRRRPRAPLKLQAQNENSIRQQPTTASVDILLLHKRALTGAAGQPAPRRRPPQPNRPPKHAMQVPTTQASKPTICLLQCPASHTAAKEATRHETTRKNK